MYVAEKFAFIELEKTGSTYIDQVMIDILDGEKSGKHDYPPGDLMNSGRDFICSVRNPFDWYVSLWAYGCKVKERSGPYRKTTAYRPTALGGYGLDKNLRFGLKAYLGYVVKGAFADREGWKAVYADHTDTALFDRWLRKIYSGPETYLYNAIYAGSHLSSYAGFFTFRYLWLTCKNREHLLSSKCPRSLDDLKDWEGKNSYVTRFIKMESMAQELLALFDEYGYSLTAEQTERLQSNKRHNASDRARRTLGYYTPETLDLIAHRDKLIIDKFGYQRPG